MFSIRNCLGQRRPAALTARNGSDGRYLLSVHDFQNYQGRYPKENLQQCHTHNNNDSSYFSKGNKFTFAIVTIVSVVSVDPIKYTS